MTGITSRDLNDPNFVMPANLDASHPSSDDDDSTGNTIIFRNGYRRVITRTYATAAQVKLARWMSQTLNISLPDDWHSRVILSNWIQKHKPRFDEQLAANRASLSVYTN